MRPRHARGRPGTPPAGPPDPPGLVGPVEPAGAPLTPPFPWSRVPATPPAPVPSAPVPPVPATPPVPEEPAATTTASAESGGSAGSGSSGGSLTSRTVRGFAWALVGTVGQAMLQTISMVVLARLLTPKEFGTATAAGLLMTLSQVVTQMGVGPALVQRKGLTDAEVSAAFWTTVTAATGVAGVLFAAAHLVNPLVGLPADSQLLRLTCLSLVLSAVAATPMALLQRRMQLRETALVDIVALGPVSIGTAIVLAWLGLGAASIVLAQIAAGLVQVSGYHLLARPSLRPTSPRATLRTARPLLGYGLGYSLSLLGNQFALQADNLVTANVLGTRQLGLYARAYQLLTQPANMIGTATDKALFPSMARVKDDGERLRTAYVRSTSLVALVTLPSTVLFFVLAPEIIGLLLGSQWNAAVAPFRVLVLVLMPRASYRISGSLTRATGAVYGGAWRQWLYAVEVFVLSGIGSHWGVSGVAAGASIAICLHFLVMLHFSQRVAAGLMGEVLRMYVKHVPLTVAAVVVTQLIASGMRHVGSPFLLTIVVTGCGWGVAVLAVVLLMRQSYQGELDVVRGALGSRGGGGSKGGGGTKGGGGGSSGSGGGVAGGRSGTMAA